MQTVMNHAPTDVSYKNVNFSAQKQPLNRLLKSFNLEKIDRQRGCK